MNNDVGFVLASAASGGQPQTFFQAFDTVVKERIGYVFMTIQTIEGDDVVRIYTTDEENYPLRAKKPMVKTAWGQQVILEQRPFLASSFEKLKEAFYDYSLLEKLGIGSQITIPIVFNGQCIGVLNLNEVEGYYTTFHVEDAVHLAQLLAYPVFCVDRDLAASSI